MKRKVLTALIVVLVAIGALWVSNYVNTTKYDRARERAARLRTETFNAADSYNISQLNHP